MTVDRRDTPPAAVVEINWQTDPLKAVDEATKLRKALLWVIIDPRDSNARELELDAFRDSEIVRLVKRYFVPVKLNSDEYPEAERLIFPLARLQSYLRPGATVLASTPTGHLIGMFRPRGAGDRMYPSVVLAQLLGLKKRLDAQLARSEGETELDAFVRAEAERLRALDLAMLPIGGDLVKAIRRSQVANLGAFNSSGYCEIRPSALDLLLRLGEVDLVVSQIEKYATSAGYDVIGGGVFDGVELSNPPRTISSKSVLTNAALAETVAQIVALRGDQNHKALLEDILLSLKLEFFSGAGVFEGRVSDTDEYGLSKRFSLTGSRIDTKLTASEAAWVRSHLLPNPPPRDYFGRLDSLERLSDPVLMAVREKLRPAPHEELQHTKENRAYVLGFVCARLLRVHQLTENKLALELFRQLEPALLGCIRGEMILRVSNQMDSRFGWLGSYLAVSEALLQKYLVLGDRQALVAVQPILRSVLRQFGSSHPEWLSITPGGASVIPGLNGSAPDLSDPGYESTISMAIRILGQFGAVLPDRDLANALHGRASGMISRIGSATQGANITAAGIVREALSAGTGQRLEVMGDVAAVARAFPLVFVSPAPSGVVLKPGIYFVENDVRSGPYTIPQVRARLTSPEPLAPSTPVRS